MKWLKTKFRSGADTSPEGLIKTLESLLDGSISSKDWGYLISMKTLNPELETLRQRAEAIWVEDSPLMLEGTMNPSALLKLAPTSGSLTQRQLYGN